MKNKRLPFIILALAAIGAIIFFAASCSKERSDLDLVNDIGAVHRLDPDHTRILDELADLPAGTDKLAYINERWPHLGRDVVIWIKSYPDHLPPDARIAKEAKIDSFPLFYGSVPDAIANDSTGKKFRGKFENRLVIAIYVHGEEKPRLYLVECANGLSITPAQLENDLQRVGQLDNEMEFYIGDGEGFCHHISFDAGIELGRACGIQFYEGKIQTPEHEISYERAWQLRNRTDETQVTAGLKKGDYFNLNTMSCKLVPR